MPRNPRTERAGGIHHVIAKGSGGESIVRDDHDRELLLAHIAEATRKHRWVCMAYALLNTHFHLVVATPLPNLGSGMQQLLAPYTRKFNIRHERAGNLFHTRFYSKKIASDAHLTSTLVYVMLNPVRAGIADTPEAWPWSSYAATVGFADAPSFLAVDAIFELVGGGRSSAQSQLRLAVAESRALDHGRSGRRAGVRHGV